MKMSEYFTAKQAARLTRLSPTMLDYLTRENFVSPSATAVRGRGRPRLFTFGDLVTLKIIAKLLSSGIEIKRLARGLRVLQKRLKNQADGEIAFRFLVSDGTDIFFSEGGDLESLTNGGQLAFAFLVDIKSCENDLKAAAIVEQKRGSSAA